MNMIWTAFGQVGLKALIQEHFAGISQPYEDGKDGVTIIRDGREYAFVPEAECNARQRQILHAARELGYPEMTQGRRKLQAVLDFEGLLPHPKIMKLNRRGKPELVESRARAFHVLRPSGSFDWAELDVPPAPTGTEHASVEVAAE